MLIILLIPILVAAEWVEISQNPYRVTHSFEETTNTNILYNNNSLSQHQWSKGYVHRVPNTGNVKRVQGIERTPTVKIERNRFHHDERIVTEQTERRLEPNKQRNTFRINERKDTSLHEQRHWVRPTSKTDLRTTHENKSINQFVFEDRNKHYAVVKNTESENINLEEVKNSDEINIRNIHQSSVRVLHTDIKKDHTESFSNIKVEKEKTSTVPNVHEKDLGKIDNIDKSKNKENKTRNKTKTSGIDALVKLLKVVSQTINQGMQRSFNSKVRYLEGLKDSLLASIEDRIDSVFPDDDTEQQRRRRAAGTEPRGHVDFPSSESALMTISFLTFAVFLIKLVLQVIHTYKAKTMMVTPAVVATVGRATAEMFKKPRNPAPN